MQVRIYDLSQKEEDRRQKKKMAYMYSAFSDKLRFVQEAVRRNPASAYQEERIYGCNLVIPFIHPPLHIAVSRHFSRSIIKFLLDSGASPTLYLLTRTNDWIVKRMLIQHMPIIAKHILYLREQYANAPAKEKKWFSHFSNTRFTFVTEITQELYNVCKLKQYVPPIIINPESTVPGRQGYLDSKANFMNKT